MVGRSAHRIFIDMLNIECVGVIRSPSRVGIASRQRTPRYPPGGIFQNLVQLAEMSFTLMTSKDSRLVVQSLTDRFVLKPVCSLVGTCQQSSSCEGKFNL